MKKPIVFALAMLMVVGLTLTVLAGGPGGKGESGFDEFGYNRTAGIFNGTLWEWCMEEKNGDKEACEEYCGIYADDKLIMKWNSEWDRGNEEEWSSPPYDAWLTNHYNGNVPGGSGETWFYKIVWDKGCFKEGVPSRDVKKGSAYCVWGQSGQFAVVMSHGTVPNEEGFKEHIWDVLLNPAGM